MVTTCEAWDSARRDGSVSSFSKIMSSGVSFGSRDTAFPSTLYRFCMKISVEIPQTRWFQLEVTVGYHSNE